MNEILSWVSHSRCPPWGSRFPFPVRPYLSITFSILNLSWLCLPASLRWPYRCWLRSLRWSLRISSVIWPWVPYGCWQSSVHFPQWLIVCVRGRLCFPLGWGLGPRWCNSILSCETNPRLFQNSHCCWCRRRGGCLGCLGSIGWEGSCTFLGRRCPRLHSWWFTL